MTESAGARQGDVLPDYLRSDYIGGIPSSILAQPGHGKIPAASGREFTYTVEPDSIYLTGDTDDGEPVSFSAGAGVEVLPTGERAPCITMDIYTRLRDGSYHPDFRAGPLLHAAIDYLNQEQPIPHFLGQWSEEGDNAAAYRRNLARFGPNPTYEQQLAAANGTWTGNMVNADGYFAAAVSTSGSSHEILYTRDAPNYSMPPDDATGVAPTA